MILQLGYSLLAFFIPSNNVMLLIKPRIALILLNLKPSTDCCCGALRYMLPINICFFGMFWIQSSLFCRCINFLCIDFRNNVNGFCTININCWWYKCGMTLYPKAHSLNFLWVKCMVSFPGTWQYLYAPAEVEMPLK